MVYFTSPGIALPRFDGSPARIALWVLAMLPCPVPVRAAIPRPHKGSHWPQFPRSTAPSEGPTAVGNPEYDSLPSLLSARGVPANVPYIITKVTANDREPVFMQMIQDADDKHGRMHREPSMPELTDV